MLILITSVKIYRIIFKEYYILNFLFLNDIVFIVFAYNPQKYMAYSILSKEKICFMIFSLEK
jgi:lipopolysaccharide biosynthesis glycosyltransferase